MTPRRRMAVGTVVVVAGITAAAALLWGGYPTTVAALAVTVVVILAVGWSFAGLGLLAWLRWPTSLTGPLMIGIGMAWFGRSIGAVDHAWAFSAGILIGSLYLGVLGHLIVTYPSGRLVTRSQQVVVAAIYLCTVPLNFTSHWVLPPSDPCQECRFNLLVVDGPDAAATVGQQILYGLVLVVTGTVLVIIVRRWRAATPAGRRSMAPVLGGAGAILVVLIIHRLGVLLHVTGTVSTLLSWAVSVVLVLWPLGMVAGLARAHMDQAAVADLVVELGGTRPDGQMRAALARALHDPSLEVAFWLPDRELFVDECGLPVNSPQEGGGRAVTMLARDGQVVAALIHDPVLADQPGLVSAVAAAAGLAVENAWLHAQAQAHLVETRASRIRIVGAAAAERRRVERNLHDGAQQRMLNLMLALRLAKLRLAGGSYLETSAALDTATAELALALTELRELARGIHPAVLTQSGLGAAVRALGYRSSVPVRVRDDLDARRFPEAVEETAYFVVSEALANIAKHAHATQAAVSIQYLHGDVLVDVTDDGIGGAIAGGGEGLRGLQDRVDAYSGQLRITSSADTGTHISAVLPCG